MAKLGMTKRRALLTAALGFRAIEWRYRPDPAGALEKYLDSWRGLGDVIVGMHAQGFDVELRQLGEHWRVNFDATGMAHSVVYGSGWEATPGRAVSRAAWQAICNVGWPRELRRTKCKCLRPLKTAKA